MYNPIIATRITPAIIPCRTRFKEIRLWLRFSEVSKGFDLQVFSLRFPETRLPFLGVHFQGVPITGAKIS